MNPSTLALIGAALALVTLQTAHAAESGAPVPRCSLTALDDARPFDTEQFRGKVVYMDFWASWCGPCAKSFPFLDALHRELEGRGLKVIGVNLDENPQDAKGFLAKYPVSFPVVADQGEQCARTFDVKAMPSSYVVGRDGIIRHVHMGFRSGDGQELRDVVEQLLAEHP